MENNPITIPLKTNSNQVHSFFTYSIPNNTNGISMHNNDAKITNK